jgi:hypothetical protein
MKAMDVMRIGRGRKRLASIAACTGLRPQNGVFGGKPDKNDQPDLGENIVVALGQPNTCHGCQQPHGHDHNDRKRQGQAFILCSQHKKHQQQRQRKHQKG